MQKLSIYIPVLIIFIFLWICDVKGQGIIPDSALIAASFNAKKIKYKHQLQNKVNPKHNFFTWPLHGALWVYKKSLSPQLSASCLYYPSCSDFSRQCIGKHGLLKGIALTADRLTRCSRLSAKEIANAVERKDGRVKDLPESYK